MAARADARGAHQMALRRHADIVFAKQRKHMPARRFHHKVRPWVRDTFGVQAQAVAVMRDPVDHLRSWYRYRRRAELDGTELSTAQCSFDDFVRQTLSDTPAPYADLGTQLRFLTGGDGALLVTHLFAWERPQLFQDFFEDRLETPLEFKRKNVSPDADAVLSPALEGELRDARRREFDLYERVAAAGYLHTAV